MQERTELLRSFITDNKQLFVDSKGVYTAPYKGFMELEGGCTTCALSRVVHAASALLKEKGEDVLFKKFKDMLSEVRVKIGYDAMKNANIVRMHSGLSLKNDPDDLVEYRVRRKQCLDCTFKHLTQAIVLLNETQQGYPEHIEIAKAHIDQAISNYTGDVSVKSAADLNNIVTNVNKLVDEGDVTASLVSSVVKEISQFMDENSNIPLKTWAVIGQLSEAADECVFDKPELAAIIRRERLALMDNPDKYTPDIVALLIEAEKARKS
jgi:hypothetical protein